ncbi:MAG TPA: hypothetical protein PL047_09860, partial [Methanothrix sp.]|nr:hypothetical protein [Methanothrix sp.]
GAVIDNVGSMPSGHIVPGNVQILRMIIIVKTIKETMVVMRNNGANRMPACGIVSSDIQVLRMIVITKTTYGSVINNARSMPGSSIVPACREILRMVVI